MFLKLSLTSFIVFITQASALNYFMSILDSQSKQVFAPSGRPSPLDYAISINEFDFDVLNTYSFAATSSGSGSSPGALQFGPLTVTRTVDQYTPVLFENCASGTFFTTVTIYVGQLAGTSQNPTVFQKYILSLSGVSHVAIASNDTVIDKTTFQYGGLEIDYAPTSPSGASGPVVQDGWNRVDNKACLGTSCLPSKPVQSSR